MSAIPIRPHHGMCLAYFRGEGYSEGFSAHMAQMLKTFESGANIILQCSCDEICSACPNNVEHLCVTEQNVIQYDKNVLEICGLQDGEQMAFDEFTRTVEKNILAQGKRENICGKCQWASICNKEISRWKNK